jgi:hypothetical protein
VKPVVALAGLSGLCATLVACGGSPPPPPAAASPKPVAAIPAPAPAPKSPVPPAPTAGAPGSVQSAPLVPVPPVPQAAGTTYDDKGRRDPFQALDTVASGAKGLEVSTTKLTGIVRSARTTLALVETSEGIGYILKPGDTLGDGRLTEIGADNVVFSVAAKPGSPTNRVVLKLAAN